MMLPFRHIIRNGSVRFQSCCRSGRRPTRRRPTATRCQGVTPGRRPGARQGQPGGVRHRRGGAVARAPLEASRQHGRRCPRDVRGQTCRPSGLSRVVEYPSHPQGPGNAAHAAARGTSAERAHAAVADHASPGGRRWPPGRGRATPKQTRARGGGWGGWGVRVDTSGMWGGLSDHLASRPFRCLPTTFRPELAWSEGSQTQCLGRTFLPSDSFRPKQETG